MHNEQKEGLNRLETIGYLPVLRNLAKSHTCSFWWFDDSEPLGKSILHNGTITFVDTGTETLGITAYHVYKGYLRGKAANGELICQIGSVTVEPEKYVAYESPRQDLVAFRLPSVLLGGTHVHVHSVRSWPPPKVKKGDLVLLGGYPGNRRQEEIGQANFDFVSFIGPVTEASDDRFSLYLNIPNSHWPQGVSLAEAPDLGGASGGPVFFVREKPIDHLEYAGVIYEASRKFEIVFARYAFQLYEELH